MFDVTRRTRHGGGYRRCPAEARIGRHGRSVAGRAARGRQADADAGDRVRGRGVPRRPCCARGRSSRSSWARAGPAVLALAITGLGGVGKTQTALAYCYQHLADYRLIWWLRAAEPATLATDFAGLATPLGLPAEQDQAKLVQAVKARLQATRDWLLVLDNAEDPAVVRPYLPGTGGGHVLITSRRTDWHGTATARCLWTSCPSPRRCSSSRAALIPRTLPAAELAEAKALAKELGYLPLALWPRPVPTCTSTGRTSLATARSSARAPQGPRSSAVCAHRTTTCAGRCSLGDLQSKRRRSDCPAARPLLELLALPCSTDALPRDGARDADPEALSRAACAIKLWPLTIARSPPSTASASSPLRRERSPSTAWSRRSPATGSTRRRPRPAPRQRCWLVERGAAAPAAGAHQLARDRSCSSRTRWRRPKPLSGSRPVSRRQPRSSTRRLSTTKLARPGLRPSRSSSAPSRSWTRACRQITRTWRRPARIMPLSIHDFLGPPAFFTNSYLLCSALSIYLSYGIRHINGSFD